MKLRVNLYQAALKPRLEKMTFNQSAWLMALALVCITFAGLWSYQQLLQQRQQADAIGKQVQSKLKELEIYQQSLAGRQPAAQLQQQAAQLQQSIAQKQQLLSYLKQEISQTPPHYSQVMSHLAAIDLPGIWLTSFQLGLQQQFQGVVKNSALLPQWLQALGKNDLLQGQSFDAVKLQPLTQVPYLSFEVSARPVAVPDEQLLQAPEVPPAQATAPTVVSQSGGQP